MTVGIILQRKTSSLVTISPEASLTEAVQSLSKNRIGAIVATGPDGRLEGILSERDVVRILGERGPDVLSEPVSSVMTRAVVTCTADETVPAIMERMTRGRFRHVPVVSGSKLVGILSLGDIVKNLLSELELEKAVLQDIYMAAH